MRDAIVAGACGAVAVLAVYGLAGLTDRTLFPWFEANQGFLSLLALVLALGFALIENHRANNTDQRQVAAYVDAVVDFASEYASEIRGVYEPGEIAEIDIVDWNNARVLKRKALDTFRTSCPANGQLILLLTELDDEFQYPFNDNPALHIVDVTPDTAPTLKDVETRVLDICKRMAALKR